MAVSAGDAFLDIHSRLAAGFGRQLASQVQGPLGRAGEEASHHFGRRFAAGLKTAAVVIGAGLVAALALARRGWNASTKAASDLNETVNKTNVIFGRSAPVIQRWARGSATALGLSRNEALTNAAAFGDMFLQLKLGLPTATRMSTRLVGLASDLASFSNADITQVLEAQQAAFRGEYDSLQRFIPAINAARVQQVALSQTHKRSVKDLTDAEKAQATYTIMLHDSVRAQGDFQRTSQELANQQRIQHAQWENLKTILGQGFLPAQLAVTRVITGKLLPAGMLLAKEFGPRIGAAVTAAATAFARSVPPASELASTAQHLGERFSQLAPQIGTRIGSALGRLVSHFRDLGPQLRSTHIEASNLPPVLNLAGAALKLVADNSGFLASHIGLLVGGLLAYKAIQTAATAAESARVVLLPLQIAGNFALARSNRALVVAMAEQRGATVASTAATNVGVAATIRQRIAAIASAVAQRAVAVATRAWAVAQRLLNLAMATNPIGLVIVAVAALAAGLIFAWRHSETFRRIVTGAFNAVQGAAVAAWGWIKGHWPLLLGILTGPVGAAVILIVRNFDKIRALPGQMLEVGKRIVRGLVDGILSMLGAVGNAARSVAQKIRDFFPLSPAKVGPLSGQGSPLHSGQAISAMLAQGLLQRRGSIDAAMAELLTPMNMGRPALAGLPGSLDISRRTAGIGVGPGIGSLTIQAITNASAADIAREVAWQQKTSGR